MTNAIDDEVIRLVRSGINTRHRLILALPLHDADAVRDSVGRLVYRGFLRTRSARLEVV